MWVRELRRAAELSDVITWLRDPQNSEWLDVDFAELSVEKSWLVMKTRRDAILLFGSSDFQQAVGAVGVHHYDARNLTAEIWIVIGNKTYSRRGLAQRALNYAVGFAFDHYALESLL